MENEIGKISHGRSVLRSGFLVLIFLAVAGYGRIVGNELHVLAKTHPDSEKYSPAVFLTAVQNNPDQINVADRAGFPPLYYAAVNLNLEYARILLVHGSDPNVVGSNTFSPMFDVIQDAQFFHEPPPRSRICKPQSMVELLLVHGANPAFLPPYQEQSMLAMATDDDDLEMVRILLDHGADPLQEFDNGRLALDEVETDAMAELLLSRMPEYYSFHVRVSPLRSYHGRTTPGSTHINTTLERVVLRHQAQSQDLPIFLFWLLGCSIMGGWVIRRRRQNQLDRAATASGPPLAKSVSSTAALSTPSNLIDTIGVPPSDSPNVVVEWTRQKPPHRYSKQHPVTQARMARRDFIDARILLWLPLSAWTLLWGAFFAHPFLRSLGLIDNLVTFGFEAGFLAVVGMCYLHDDRAYRWLPIAGFLVGVGAIAWCGREYMQIIELHGLWARVLLVGSAIAVILWLALMSSLYVLIRLMHRRNQALGVLDTHTAADAKEDFTMPDKWDEAVPNRENKKSTP